MRNLYFRFVPFFVISLFLATSSADTMTVQDANALFSRANASYRAQKFEEAAAGYKQLVEAGYESAPVLYNMGTTAARLDKSGEALGYLMRAQTLSPRDDNITANLNRVKLEHAQELGLDDESAAAATAESIWSRVIGILTAEEWLIVIWFSLTLACFGGFILLVLHRPGARVVAKVAIAVGLTVLAVVIIPGGAQVYRTRVVNKAVALGSAEVLSGPADRFTRVAQLQEGQLVRKLGQHTDGYYRVRLDNGLQGYVETSALMEL